MRKGIQEITYMEMALVGAAAIIAVLLIKVVAGVWFLLPLIPALFISLPASIGIMRDEEFRFEGAMFFLLGSVLLLTTVVDTIRFAF